MKDKYQKTIYACFIGYVVQAVVNNFVPLLFLTFEKTYGIPLSKITMLITLNFGVQLIVDLLSAGFVLLCKPQLASVCVSTGSESGCRVHMSGLLSWSRNV